MARGEDDLHRWQALDFDLSIVCAIAVELSRTLAARADELGLDLIAHRGPHFFRPPREPLVQFHRFAEEVVPALRAAAAG